ncbi:stealth family protein [Megamonas hypermegale]|uniref:stealth family protein n=1 Tax=Megamonas hypermegale TaxID=158847 RepID=UPI00195B37CC|nr:stealth family protein [Megamonas hypermegale]MBM6761622.1 Stealth CR1 domain-containing protein [Megamonas hypermegale]
MNNDNYPIDFVVTWVDGNDPVWQADKAKYSPKKNEDSRNIRYRDWDNMQYWFRAVEKFAPWVNKVHFVTYGHLPKWLNTDCPKLHIAKHSDFIPKEYLPTFNSQSIELNLHRIKGLAEHFVYFNDDMFLLKPVPRELFFKDGLPTDFAIASTLSVTDKSDTVQFTKFNNVVILNSHFDKKEQVNKNFSKWVNLAYGWNALRNLILIGEHHFKCFANNHLAISYLKNSFTDLWSKEFDELNETCKHKFRTKSDVNHWLIRYWQLAKGDFSPIGRHVKGKVYEVYNGVAQNQELFNIIENQTMPMICINDNENIDFEPMEKRLKEAFDKILPEKSSFEK